ncbi:hypothetical protein FNB15_07700 [Ferrovibrio terrae]|uniref:Uncharacterized protein n=1 Tax=Ferrovibrio terrae TaxID=2594003 RepID=A0A516H0Q6_9PROT|nr:hypothetical protein [Ferrovibrio terrae]QDO97160.1 hypothetical protein FNB15_07700 [Ferrovibrio terrae]
MINWIDILSPKLRQLHQDWIHYRGNFLMPSVTDYNAFASVETVEESSASSAAVLLPAEGGPVFKHIGLHLTNIIPDCKPGMRFAELRSPVTRAAVTAPYHRIVTARQPEVRRNRGSHGAPDFEMLMLPFCDARLHVRIIHTIYDLAGIDWKRAFK